MTAGSAAAGPPAAAASLAVPRRALAPLGRWGCGNRGQIQDIYGCARNLMADVALDVGQRDGILFAAKADGVAGGAGARRTSDAVHVVLGIVR
jgi:hypothetical protein